MGQWFIVEIVHHLPMSNGASYDMRELSLDTCPTLHLVQEDFNNIRLKWNENDIDLYYHAKRTDPKALGFWISSGPNKGKLKIHNPNFLNLNFLEPFLDRHSYHFQYSGTIEVMKAVGNHAVLTFCKSDHSDSQLFSVVIAREPWLPRVDTRSVNSMLESRGLHIVLIKRTCSGAGIVVFSASLLLISLIGFLV